jgi:hypothetical protein
MMAEAIPFTFNGPDGLIKATFGEATTEQQVQCSKLAATAFSSPLSEEAYMERERYLSQRPLVRDGGWRCWCLFRTDNPAYILATCKTIRRDIFIRDEHTVHKELGFCISSFITDPRYRQLGLGSLLLRCVAEWMDGPGNATVSMLYTSIGEVSTRTCHHLRPIHLSNRIIVLCQ